MDQGIAALLGASVGVAGTILASAIAGWSTRQQVRAQDAHDQLALAQAAWANLAVEGPAPVEQAARGVYSMLRSMQTTLLALRDSPENTPDRNAGFLERHAVEAGQVTERIGEFAVAARAALDDFEGLPPAS